MPIEHDDAGAHPGADETELASDRQLVVNLLIAAHDYGKLPDREFSLRMIRVQGTRSFDDLIPIAHDLMRA